MGRLEAIWIKRAKLGPMDPVERARLVVGGGIEGNSDFRTMREVTLISAESWRDAEAELGREVDPRARRANLMIAGVELENARGRVLAIGAVRIRIRGEVHPCERMDEASAGLRAALRPHWRAGAWGRVLDAGEIVVGDPVDWSADDSPATP